MMHGEERHSCDGEPDEHTALLRNRRHLQYETATVSVDRQGDMAQDGAAEQDTPTSPSRSELLAGPTTPAAEPPRPASPGPIPGPGDAEAARVSPGGDTDGPDASRPSNFLIHTHPSRFRVVFAGVMLTYFIAIFDGTIMASSHPVITSYFGASRAASWLTTAFLLTSTALQPLVGRLSDTLGRRPLYLSSLAVFAAATAWCALAGSVGSFVAARAVCGLGAGGMMTLGAIVVSDCVPIEQRGTYQSIINVVYGLAAASGAAFGGLLADSLGWRWEFGIQLVPLALCIATAALSMPADLGLQSTNGQRKQTLVQALRGFDFKGSALLTTSTTFLILGLNLGGTVLPWSHPFILASLAIFTICFPTCLYIESLVERPVMPLALLHSAPRANIIFSNFIASFLLNAILFNLPLFFRAVLLRTATTSGLYLILPTITASITGTLTGLLITHTKRLKWPLVSGAASYLLGSALLSALPASGWPTWGYLACLLPAAVGQGLQFPGTFIAVLAASEQAEQAVVTSTLQLWRALGNVLGVAGSSVVFQNALLGYLVEYVSAPGGDGDGDGGNDSGGGGGQGEEWKRRLIERVRSSIEAVAELPEGKAKEQVVMSYAAACRATFLVCLGLAFVSVALVLPVRLPRLGRK